jgi:hypothetical protein
MDLGTLNLFGGSLGAKELWGKWVLKEEGKQVTDGSLHEWSPILKGEGGCGLISCTFHPRHAGNCSPIMRHVDVKSGQPLWMSQKIGGPEAMGCDAVARGQVAPGSPREQVPRNRMPAGGQKRPPGGSVLEMAHPEMAGDIPWGLTSITMTSKPDEGSWDFDRRVSTLVRNRTRRSPMLTMRLRQFWGLVSWG